MDIHEREEHIASHNHPGSSSTTPELGLGCWAFGDAYWRSSKTNGSTPSAEEYKAYKAVLRSALREGIRHFDTAQGYGNGISEQVTGQFLRNVRRNVSISSKTFYRPADTIEAGIKKSLRRLSSDYIDIFYLHWPKPSEDLRPHIEAMERARQQGLIRSIGVSNFSPAQIRPLLEAGRIDYCQFAYSLLWRSPETSLIPFCREHGIKIVTYSSLAQGLLSHAPGWAESLDSDDPRRNTLFMKTETWPLVSRFIRDFHRLAEELKLSPAQMALSWNLSRKWASYVLFGARSPSQVRECSGSKADLLSPEIVKQLDHLSAPLADVWKDEDNIFGHRPG